MSYLRLLGPPQFETLKRTVPLERKMAGLLAYLALEGPTHKYKLAGYLWPDAEETTARGNMRQLLRRIRVNVQDMVAGDDLIELRPEVEVDVQKLSYLETPSLDLLKQEVELLAGLEYDDTYDFAEWLTGAREELKDLRSRSARSEAERLERMGNHRQALEYAQVWVRLEPLSEEAHRLVIRLHYLLGDRGAALAAFERCKQVLQQELGTQPLPETLSLLGLIEQGAQLQGIEPKPKETNLPTAILRPPVLAGREREWALMEEAWARKQIIYLVGEPGVGKTRLALDFAASKGKVFHFKARPGDAGVPFSTLARATRETLEALPQLLQQLPTWVRRELPRLLPELLEGEALPPLASEADKLRFFEAMGQVVAARGRAISVVDDIQFVDSATAEATFFLMARFASNPNQGGPRLMGMYRRGELRPEIEERINELVEANLAVRIDVEPLSTQAISTMLQALNEPGLGELAEALKRFTGGNPLFILETLKDLIESGNLQQGFSARFTPPGKVLSLIARRLQRLSPLAANLARCAAVARTQFALELAGVVLERPAFELAEAHAELEAAQVLRANAFTHDLVFEATLAGTPAAVKQVLHASTARYLQSKGTSANPALIAQHWEAAGDGDKAAEWLINAAKAASNMGLYAEELGLLERAIKAASSKVLRQEAQVMLSDTLGPLGRVEESIELAHQVLDETEEPRLKQRALSVLQNMYQGTGRFEQAERFIDQGLELAIQLGEDDRADGMRFAKARVLRNLGRYNEAAQIFESIMPRYANSPFVAERVQILSVLGATYNQMGQHPQARPLLQKAYALTADLESAGPALRILAAAHLLYGLICQDETETFLEEAEAALNLGSYSIADQLRNHLALAYLRLGRVDEAGFYYQVLAEKAFDPNLKSAAWARLAALSGQAEVSIQKAQELYPQARIPTTRFTVVQAAILYGSVQQKTWALGELKTLEASTIPWLFLKEYKQLKQDHSGPNP